MEENKMEPIIQIQPQQLKPTGAPSATARAALDGDQTVTDIVRNAAQALRVQVEDRSAEIIDRMLKLARARCLYLAASYLQWDVAPNRLSQANGLKLTGCVSVNGHIPSK
jgi:hypothetical protein